MNKKLKSFLGMMVFAFAMIPLVNVSALTDWKLEDWTSGNGYGTATKVDGNITNVKGETTAVAGMFVGPYSKASTQKLVDGIKEEIYVEIDPAKFNAAEFFELSLALRNAADEYVTEAVIMAQKEGDGAIHIKAGWAPNFDVVIDEAGVYTIRYDMFIENNQTFVEVTVLKWDEVVGKSGKIDMDTMTTADTKNPVKDHAVDVKYLWFSNVNMENGVNVYTVLPEKPVVTPVPTPTPTPTPDNTVTENPETNDGVMSYIILAILGLGTVAVSAKKLNKNNA